MGSLKTTARNYLEKLRRRRGLVVIICLIILVGATTALLITPYQAKPAKYGLYGGGSSSSAQQTLRARVVHCSSTDCEVVPIDGSDHSTITINASDNYSLYQREQDGSIVLITRYQDGNSSSVTLADSWRMPMIIVLLTCFVALIVLVTGMRSILSLIGLGIGLLIIAYVIMPSILMGFNPLLVMILGSYLIGTVTVFVAHGLKRRAVISAIVMIVALSMVIALTLFAMHFVSFNGITDEITYYLHLTDSNLRLTDIFTGGIIIASIGVLDDVITTQVAATDEILQARPGASVKELYRRSSRVGLEHVSSLVNTLVLAYVGASLPLVIQYAGSVGYGTLMTLNSELVSEEVIRTLLLAIGLVLAVPLSTYLGAVLLHNWPRLKRRFG